MFDEWVRVVIFLIAVAIIMTVVCSDDGIPILLVWVIIGLTIWVAFNIQRGFNQADISRRRRRKR